MDLPGKQTGHWIICSAMGVLVALAVLPRTGPLMREQFRALAFNRSQLNIDLSELGVMEVPGLTLDRKRPQASAGPDYGSQLEVAKQYVTTTAREGADFVAANRVRIDHVRQLADRFPDHRKQILAHSLRFATQALIHLHRDWESDEYLSGKPPGPYSPANAGPIARKPPEPTDLAAFLADAEAGERLDPDNAYFPMMRALGLFSAHRDPEGIAAIILASSRARFDDYALDEPEASIRRDEALGIQVSVLRRKATYAATLLPHYSELRAMARLTAYLAARAEAAGRVEDGYAIRRAMMRCADRFRSDSRIGTGSRTGSAMFAIQLSRPGGADPFTRLNEKAWAALGEEEHLKRRLNAYQGYLRLHRHASEAAWVQRESAAISEMNAILDTSKEGSNAGDSHDASNMFLSWVLSMTLLANALGLVALCCAMLLLQYMKRDKGRLPAMAVVGVIALLTLIVGRTQWSAAMGAVIQVFQNLSSDGTASMLEMNGRDLAIQALESPIVGRTVIACLSLLAPLLTVFALAIAGRIRKERERSVFASALSGGGTIVALVLVVFYAGAVTATAAEENAQNRTFDSKVKHEGRYWAERKHKTWPEAVNESN